MADEKLCQKFLRSAAETVRNAGLARGTRKDKAGRVCMLGAMDFCPVRIDKGERKRIEAHITTLLPIRPAGAVDRYNPFNHGQPADYIAWWSNMQAEDAKEVAQKFDEAAESC